MPAKSDIRKSADAVKRSPSKPSYAKSENAKWFEQLNPLRSLTIARAAEIYDWARQGNYADLQWLYNEIEQAFPVLFVCAERRASSLSQLDWLVRKSDDKRSGRKWDDVLSEEQQAFLTEAFGACDNLYDGLARLGTAFFRGFAHCRPEFSSDLLSLDALVPLDGWNFCRDFNGRWYWNPDASRSAPEQFAPIPDGELCTLSVSRHIDYPALNVSIRQALGEKKYGQFLEAYGVPPCMIIMPEFANKTEEDTYMAAAAKVAAGGSGALPYGSTVNYATEARGTNPFLDYFAHQEKLIVLMATGGLLTSLAESGSGTLAGGAHQQSFDAIVSRDSRFVAQAVNRSVSKRLLSARFPGKPALAYFDFETDPPPGSSEILDDAAKAVLAGYRIERSDLEERTGYTLVDIPPSSPSPTSNLLPTTSSFLNKAADLLADSKGGKLAEASRASVLKALDADLQPLRERLAKALQSPDSSLQAELDKVLADLPAVFAKISASGQLDKALEDSLTAALFNGFAAEAAKRKLP
jgi:hypothetical protein